MITHKAALLLLLGLFALQNGPRTTIPADKDRNARQAQALIGTK